MNFITQWLVGAVLEEQRAERIDVAKAAVLREMAAIDEERARRRRQPITLPPALSMAWPAPRLMADEFEAEVHAIIERITESGVHTEEARRKRELHALLEDDAALLAYHERKAGALSVSTAGGELSEVER